VKISSSKLNKLAPYVLASEAAQIGSLIGLAIGMKVVFWGGIAVAVGCVGAACFRVMRRPPTLELTAGEP